MDEYDYIIEASKDGIHWIYQTGFRKGQRSRFNDAPFDYKVAITEAMAFKRVKIKDYSFVRLIINI